MSALMAQWQGNPRLRYASGIALLFVLLHVAASLGESRRMHIADYRNGQQLLSRLQGAAGDDAWLARAEEAEAAWQALEATLPVAASAGEAQAELQAQVQELAVRAGVVQPRIRAEAAVVLETLPELRVVLVRLDGSLPADAIRGLLAALAEHPWISVERIELRDGSPGQIHLIVRGHFRSASGEAR